MGGEVIYLIGSLRNPRVPKVAQALRSAGHEVYDEWYSPGPNADTWWQTYEKQRGHSYRDALDGWHAQMVFENDQRHLLRADAGVLLLPAGRSAHMELGWLRGMGKPAYVLFDGEPERYDVMYRFASGVCFSVEELVECLR